MKAYDLSPEARAGAKEAGMKAVDTVAEAVSGVEYVVTALPQTHHVEEALVMDGGIF